MFVVGIVVKLCDHVDTIVILREISVRRGARL